MANALNRNLRKFGGLVGAAFRDPEGTPDRLTVISLADEEQDRLTTPKRLEPIRTLRDRGELTVSELAEALGRRVDTISRDLHTLAKHDIIAMEKEGRTKRVRLATDLILLYVAARMSRWPPAEQSAHGWPEGTVQWKASTQG